MVILKSGDSSQEALYRDTYSPLVLSQGQRTSFALFKPPKPLEIPWALNL